MKLANIDQADVPQAKITGYLLSTTHRDGKHKAAFFLGFGFQPEDWQQLAKALRNHAQEHDFVKEEPSPFGRRYVVEGTMPAPYGRAPKVRKVWFIDTGQEIPRFVTAYPLKGADDE
jgi:hypothetical protein